MHPEAARQAAERQLRREAKFLYKARHRHVVKLIMTYSSPKADGGLSFSIVMEKADHNLEHYIQRGEIRVEWFGCLINAMAYIHELGIWHRDIKPSNILVKDGKVLLADFGVSKAHTGKHRPLIASNSSRNQVLPGTRMYFAPEMENKESIGGLPADIFSLGLVFLEMVASKDCTNEQQSFLRDIKHKKPSFACELDKIHLLMEQIGSSWPTSQGPEHWHSQIRKVGIPRACLAMLDKGPHKRPTADDLRSWWKYRRREEALGCACDATPSDDAEHDRPTEGDLRRAYGIGYRLTSKELEGDGVHIDKCTMLLAAAKGGLWDLVEDLANTLPRSDVAARDDAGRTVLHYVAREGNNETCLRVASKLLDKLESANILTRDGNDKTALRMAAESGCPDMIWQLLRRLAPNSGHMQRAHPIHMIFGQDGTKKDAGSMIADFLRNNSSSVDETRIQLYRREVLSGLLNTITITGTKGAGEDEAALLWRAGVYHHGELCPDECTWALFEAGHDIEEENEHKQTPLSIAAMHGHEAVVRLLLHHGADMNTKDKLGRTPLSVAAEYGYSGIVRLLLERHMAEHQEQRGGIDHKDDFGRTPLHKASDRGHLDVVKLLLDEGADVTVRDKASQTALSRAYKNGHWAIVSLLVEEGAAMDVEALKVLHGEAAGEGHWAATKVLAPPKESQKNGDLERNNCRRIENWMVMARLTEFLGMLLEMRVKDIEGYWTTYIWMACLLAVARVLLMSTSAISYGRKSPPPGFGAAEIDGLEAASLTYRYQAPEVPWLKMYFSRLGAYRPS
jgi:ankyrin repeat protein